MAPALRALAAPWIHASPLMTTMLVFATHTLTNSLLLSSYNPLRCEFWNQEACSQQQESILNVVAFGHLHVAILLVCLAFSSMGDHNREMKVAVLSSLISNSYLAGGILSMDVTNETLNIYQCIILISLFLSTMIWSNSISTEEADMVGSEDGEESTSMLSKEGTELSVAPYAVAIELSLSFVRIFDISYSQVSGGSREDSSSPAYQNMSHWATWNMVLPIVVLLFTFAFGTVHQQKAILYGQAFAIAVGTILLAFDSQAVEQEQVQAGLSGGFYNVAMLISGAL